MMLRIGGYLNILISFGHIAGLFWTEQMFRLTGVERQMKELSAIHYTLPYVLTFFVGFVFCVFGLYGLSATKKWIRLPFQKTGIYLISGIYFLRGLGELLTDGLSDTSTLTGTVYSIIAICIATLYLSGGLGLKQPKD